MMTRFLFLLLINSFNLKFKAYNFAFAANYMITWSLVLGLLLFILYLYLKDEKLAEEADGANLNEDKSLELNSRPDQV